MWPATAAVSAGMALVLKLRGDHLSRQCDRTLEELEATEDDLDEVKMKVKSLMEQVKVQESTIMEVSASNCRVIAPPWRKRVPLTPFRLPPSPKRYFA